MHFRLFQGDCIEVMRSLPDASVDSVVCDPPYGIRIAGHHWDYDIPSVDVWCECLRVMKDGAYLLAFAGTRTQHRMAVNIEDAGFEINDIIVWAYAQGMPKHNSKLKPAIEPVTMARKPAKKATPLNIDVCRVPRSQNDRFDYGVSGDESAPKSVCFSDRGRVEYVPHGDGRYPSNLCHDGSEVVTALFPLSAGSGPSLPNVKISGYGGGVVGNGKSEYFGGPRRPVESGSGSAARFFFCAKANKKDRGEGNSHPTAKPTELMRYLCRLVTPAHGLILDPFVGSGGTGKAAILEGFDFIGIEREAEYLDIARARIAKAQAEMFDTDGEL